MTVKTILTEPNTILRQISQPVEHVGENEQRLMDDMLETMSVSYTHLTLPTIYSV